MTPPPPPGPMGAAFPPPDPDPADRQVLQPHLPRQRAGLSGKVAERPSCSWLVERNTQLPGCPRKKNGTFKPLSAQCSHSSYIFWCIPLVSILAVISRRILVQFLRCKQPFRTPASRRQNQNRLPLSTPLRTKLQKDCRRWMYDADKKDPDIVLMSLRTPTKRGPRSGISKQRNQAERWEPY